MGLAQATGFIEEVSGPHSTNEVLYLIYCQQQYTMLHKLVTGTHLVIILTHFHFHNCSGTQLFTATILSVHLSACLFVVCSSSSASSEVSL
jgi:hypothetical protein